MNEPIDQTLPGDRLEQVGQLALYGVAGALQFSIAIAQILLTVSLVCWVAMLATGRTRFAVPRFFWPLIAYVVVSLVSTAFSPQPRVSLMADKQMVLFVLVPLVFALARGSRAATCVTVILTCAAASAAV